MWWKICCNFVPGLGESHFSLASLMLSDGRYLTCIDHINEAVKYLARAAIAR